MTTPQKKLYGPRQIMIIAGAMLAGIGLFLFRRYHETGQIGSVEWIATGFTVLACAIIVLVVVRIGNKKE
jgi:hypothetical protein